MEEMYLSDSVKVKTKQKDSLRMYEIHVGNEYVTLMSDEADGLLEFIKETIDNE